MNFEKAPKCCPQTCNFLKSIEGCKLPNKKLRGERQRIALSELFQIIRVLDWIQFDWFVSKTSCSSSVFTLPLKASVSRIGSCRSHRAGRQTDGCNLYSNLYLERINKGPTRLATYQLLNTLNSWNTFPLFLVLFSSTPLCWSSRFFC